MNSSANLPQVSLLGKVSGMPGLVIWLPPSTSRVGSGLAFPEDPPEVKTSSTPELVLELTELVLYPVPELVLKSC